MYLRRVRVTGLSFAAALARVQPLLRRLRLRLKTSAWASNGPAGGGHSAGEHLDKFKAEQSKYYQFYLYSG
jgi:hypothetical protein